MVLPPSLKKPFWILFIKALDMPIKSIPLCLKNLLSSPEIKEYFSKNGIEFVLSRTSNFLLNLLIILLSEESIS